MCHLQMFKKSLAKKTFEIPTHPSSAMKKKPTIRNQKKAVSLNHIATVHPINELSSQMTNEEKSRLYFSQEELNRITFEARALRAASANTTVQECLNADESLRGFELRICRERALNKFIANRAVLKYQRVFASSLDMDDETKSLNLAIVSAKMNNWSRHIASETAQIDFLRTQEGGGKLILLNTPADISPFPRIKLKRRVSVNNEGQLTSKMAKC